MDIRKTRAWRWLTKNRKDGVLEQKFKEATDSYPPREGVRRIITKGPDGKLRTPESFVANGTKYVVRPVTQFTIDKQVQFRHLNYCFSAGETGAQTKQAIDEAFQSLAQGVIQDNEKARAELLSDALVKLKSLRDTMFNPDMNTAVYGSALYIATLFIMPEDVSHTHPWTFDLANKWINDWSIECIPANDFFCL